MTDPAYSDSYIEWNEANAANADGAQVQAAARAEDDGEAPVEFLADGLTRWAAAHGPAVRAATELIIWHDRWLRRGDFHTACIGYDNDVTPYINWVDAARFCEDPPPCSMSELTILRIATMIVLDDYALRELGRAHRAAVVAAFTTALEVTPPVKTPEGMAARFKEARDYFGFTVGDACGALHCDPHLIEGLEDGTVIPSPELLTKLGALYRRPLGWFTGEWQAPEPGPALLCGPEPATEGDLAAVRKFQEFLAGAGEAPKPLRRKGATGD